MSFGLKLGLYGLVDRSLTGTFGVSGRWCLFDQFLAQWWLVDESLWLIKAWLSLIVMDVRRIRGWSLSLMLAWSLCMMLAWLELFMHAWLELNTDACLFGAFHWCLLVWSFSPMLDWLEFFTDACLELFNGACLVGALHRCLLVSSFHRCLLVSSFSRMLDAFHRWYIDGCLAWWSLVD